MEELGNRKQWEKYTEMFLMKRKGRDTCKKHANRNAAKHRITATFSFKNTHKNNFLPSTLDKVWMRAAFSLLESILVMISIWKKTSKKLQYCKKICSFSLHTSCSLLYIESMRLTKQVAKMETSEFSTTTIIES